MKVPLITLVFCTIVFAFNQSNSNPPVTQDSYDVEQVKSWVELPSEDTQGISFIQKAIFWRGDRIALGAVHAFSHKQLLDSERLLRTLSLIRLSFSCPECIQNEADKNPAVTMLLLSFLEHNCSDTGLKKKISETREYVATQVHLQAEGATN
jgi:hypothetical protein